MDTVGVDPIGGLEIAGDLGQVDKVFGLALDLRPERSSVVSGERVAEQLDAAPVRGNFDEINAIMQKGFIEHILISSDPDKVGQKAI